VNVGGGDGSIDLDFINLAIFTGVMSIKANATFTVIYRHFAAIYGCKTVKSLNLIYYFVPKKYCSVLIFEKLKKISVINDFYMSKVLRTKESP
jgi:hypothetical protein